MIKLLKKKMAAQQLEPGWSRVYLDGVLHHYYFIISHIISYHISSKKYVCFTGHKDSWYLQSELSEDDIKAVTSCSTHKIDQQETDG